MFSIGLVPGLLMVTPQAGMHFGFYSLYKHLWRYSLYETVNYTHSHVVTMVMFQTAAFEGSIGIDSLICGVMAGVSSKTIALPLDTVKKRLEVRYIIFTGTIFCIHTGTGIWYSKEFIWSYCQL